MNNLKFKFKKEDIVDIKNNCKKSSIEIRLFSPSGKLFLKEDVTIDIIKEIDKNKEMLLTWK